MRSNSIAFSRQSEPIYHIEDVAWLCGVTIDTVKGWIDMGLRHLPLGRSENYQPRDALIREAWLTAFLDAQAVVRPKRTPDARPVVQAAQPADRASQSKPGKRPKENVLGPCPV